MNLRKDIPSVTLEVQKRNKRHFFWSGWSTTGINAERSFRLNYRLAVSIAGNILRGNLKIKEATNMRLQWSKLRHTGEAADAVTFPCCYCLDSNLDRVVWPAAPWAWQPSSPSWLAVVKETEQGGWESHRKPAGWSSVTVLCLCYTMAYLFPCFLDNFAYTNTRKDILLNFYCKSTVPQVL